MTATIAGTSPPSGFAPHVGLARGTLLVSAAEALAFPAGLAATILLTRQLTTGQYGALALGLSAIAWLEWTVVSLFARAAFKLVAEQNDWQGVAFAVLRLFLGFGLVAGLLVFAVADRIAGLFGAPELTGVLRILAVEIPLFTTAQGYRTILVGRGLHGARAAVAATRWTARALLIAAGVLLGFSLHGLAAMIAAATAVELALVRWRVGPALRGVNVTRLSMTQLITFAAPLAISAICLRLFDRLDLFLIRLLGAPLETVAAYGVAQNLALAPAFLASAFVPGLIAALSYRFAQGDAATAHRTATAALRMTFRVLPAACVAGGAAPVLVETLFGASYRAAAPFFAALLIAGVGMLIVSVSSSILLAAGRPGWTLGLTAPLLPAAAVAHLLIIPRTGAIGAAAVTAATAVAGGLASCIALRRVARTPLPLATLLRAVIVGTLAFWAGRSLLPGPGIAGLLGVIALAAAVLAALVLTGELTARERQLAAQRASAAFRWARNLAA